MASFADDMIEHLSNRFNFEHHYESKLRGIRHDWTRFNVIYPTLFQWTQSLGLPPRKTVSSLRTHWFRHLSSDYPQPRPEDFNLVNAHRAFHTTTRAAFEILRPRCPGAAYLTNPVSMKRFPKSTEVAGEVVCEWNGNANHCGTDLKGFSTIITPACQHAGVRLEVAEYNTRRLSPTQMPAFYQRANVALCASRSEGASNSIMEAMASGLALVSTCVGNVPEMHESSMKNFGESGIMLVERSVPAFTQAIAALKKDPARVKAMGEINRAEISARWSWSTWAEKYESFFKMAL